MKTKPLGWTDLSFTCIGLGTWAMGGSGWKFSWGPQDDASSIQAIHRALDLGVNWIDVAPAYGLGHAEEVVGRALKDAAQRPWIATKCGRSWDENGQLYPSLRKDVVKKEVDASLRRLQTEVIDLYQIHWPQPDEQVEEGWDAIAECVKAGKIRYAGVCNFTVDQIKRIQPIHPVASAQPPYSMIVRQAEEELLPYCAANQIGVVAYSPMQKGLLTDKLSADWVRQLPEEDHRSRDPQFQGPLLEANLELVSQLRSLAQNTGKSVGQLAVAWVLRRPEVTAAIVGARRPAQIEEIVQAADWSLSEEEIRHIDELLENRPTPE